MAAVLTRRTDRLMLVYLALTGLALILLLPPSFPVLSALHLAAGITILSLRSFRERPRGIAQFLRDWYPAIAFPILYKEVELLASTIGNWTLTGPLQNLEAALFAGQPSLYLSERLSWVWLSEYVHFCYFAYVLLFPVIGGIWYFTGKRHAFRELLFLMSVTFATSYLFYILFPVDSPFYLSPKLGEPLSGHFFYELVHFVSSRAGARGGAFPSLHVSISTVILLVTLKYQRRWLYWVLPIYTGLVFATVYGRFHYLLDVIAGWALALVVVGSFNLFETKERPASVRSVIYN